MAQAASKDIILEEIRSLSQSIHEKNSGFHEEKFLEAFEFARSAHEGQFRKDGTTPYIIHPLQTAKILSEFFADEETLIAALLHDVPEDTSRSLEEIEELFGTPVAFLVDGITKLSKVHYQNNMAARQVESLKKLLLHTARDPRVILIKLADRLHNMRTLQFVDKPEKRLRIARETLEIYVPMANLLGIQGIKSELEDLCFQHLYPHEYASFRVRIETSEKKLRPLLTKTLELLQQEFQKHDLDAAIMYRKKTLYSIFQKLFSEKKEVEDVYDLITLRILVDNADDCYKALGIIHALFKPKTGRFKDYIALPKLNEYRSLHTTVFGLSGVLTEFQIRTHEMHRAAEFGIATKISLKKHPKDSKTRQFWIDQILQYEQEKDSEEFLSNIKGDVFQDRIYIFTPTGDAIFLPKGATGIDFAYAVHTDVGDHAVRLEVNGEERNLTSQLRSGDTVKVILSDKSKGPEYEWLTFAKTSFAKTRIREYLKKESRKNKIGKGKMILQKAFDRAGLGPIEEIDFFRLQKSLQQYLDIEFSSLADLLVSVAEGAVDPLEVIGSLFPERKLVQIHGKSFFGSFFDVLFTRKKTAQIVEVRISGKDRPGLIKDIVTILGMFSLNIVELKGWHETWGGRDEGVVIVTLELQTFDILNSICAHLEQIDGVEKVERVIFGQQAGFIFSALFTVGFWLAHPFLLNLFFQSKIVENRLIINAFLLFGVFMIIFLSIYLHIITRRYFAAFRQAKGMFLSTLFISLFALATVIGELFYYRTYFTDSVLITLGLISVVFYLGYQFFQFRKIKKL